MTSLSAADDTEIDQSLAQPPTSGSESDTTERENAELERLRQEVLTLVAPYEGKLEEPPFSTPELVVISAVCWDHSTKFMILNGVLSNFPYFGRMAISEYVSTQFYWLDNETPKPDEVVPGFDDAFGVYYLPFAAADGQNAIVPFLTEDEPQKIRVRPRAARVFLRDLLEPERKGTLPFLELPAELRNAIYEMLFTFPAEGIAVAQRTCDALPGLLVHRRREDEFVPHRVEYLDFGSNQGELLIDQDTLWFEILRVNRQIREEALPLFYGLNHFCCIDPKATSAFLHKLNPDKLKFVRDIRLNLSADCGDLDEIKEFRSIMRAFATVAHLRRLEIETDDHDWIGMRKHIRQRLGREKPIKTFDQVPGFDALVELCSKAETLVFIGDRKAGIEKWIKAQVEGIKKQSKDGIGEGTKGKGGNGTTVQTKRKTRAGADESTTGKKKTTPNGNIKKI